MQAKQVDIAGITIGLGNLTLTGISGAATTYSSSALPFCVNGKATTYSAQSGVAFPTTDLNTGAQFVGLVAASTGTVYVVGVQSGGTTLKCIQGSVELLDAAGNFINVPKFGPCPDNFCPLAYIVAKAGSTLAAPHYPGTTNWNATGMSYAVVNVAALSDRPQVS